MSTIFTLKNERDMDGHLEAGAALLGPLYREDDLTRWMAHYPDATKLSSMTIPGTHDSAAYNYKDKEPEWWNCQSTSLFRQLDAGIRALDIRYALENDIFRLVHAGETLDRKAQLEDIIHGLHRWVQLHPTETIIVSMKYDRPNDSFPEKKRQEEIQTVLGNTCNFWLEGVTTNTTLGEARGKLVLLRRFALENGPGFDVSHDWKPNHPGFAIRLASGGFARIEDFYLLKTNPGDTAHHLDEKWRETVNHLQAACDDIPRGNQNIWITFTSAVGDKNQEGEDVTPRIMALGRGEVKGVNQRLVQWCQANPYGHLGIILMDFVSIRRKSGSEEEEEDTDLIRELVNRRQPS